MVALRIGPSSSMHARELNEMSAVVVDTKERMYFEHRDYR